MGSKPSNACRAIAPSPAAPIKDAREAGLLDRDKDEVATSGGQRGRRGTIDPIIPQGRATATR